MKKLALAILMTLPIYANATNYGNPLQGSSAISNSSAIQGQAQTQNNAVNVQGATNGAISNTSSGGNSSVNVDNDTRMPASSAIAPSVGTSNNCLIATPSSAAVNILFGGVSKTTGFHYSGLCLAYRMNDMALVEKLMCLEDKNYAKLNSKCSK